MRNSITSWARSRTWFADVHHSVAGMHTSWEAEKSPTFIAMGGWMSASRDSAFEK